jgi:uncharacterized membrane protein YphA (DoxX/SURF4 family)
MLFGVLWAFDAGLGLVPNTAYWFQEQMIAAGTGQPPWLSGWFAFWLAQAKANGTAWVTTVAGLELLVAIALIFGFLRKIAYLGGLALSLLIWATAEGFGGPYGPGTLDVGAGVVYAVAFMFLLLLDGALPFDPHTLDAPIERRWPAWGSWAEVARAPVGPREPARRPEPVPSNAAAACAEGGAPPGEDR